MDKMAFKKRIFEIIERSKDDDKVSSCYDLMMTTAIAVGLVPLMIKHSNRYSVMIDVVTIVLFIIDYILRIYTSDYKMGFVSYKAYIANILSPMSIIDLVSIIPIVSLIFPGITLLRLLRLLRVFRIFKLARYSRTMITIKNVMYTVRKPLSAVLILALAYILICALIMFQVEPDSFHSFLDAFYWSTISLTTVGYGDFAPVSAVGKLIVSISSLVGVAVIALPSSIITAAYMREITKKKSKHEL